MSTAHHIDRMKGTILPTRTDAREVKHAATLSEIAWGRYHREGTESRKHEWETARRRMERLVDLLATENGRAEKEIPGTGLATEDSRKVAEEVADV